MSPSAAYVLDKFCTEQDNLSQNLMGLKFHTAHLTAVAPCHQVSALAIAGLVPSATRSRGSEEKVGWMNVDCGRRHGPSSLRMFTLALTWEVNIPFCSRNPPSGLSGQFCSVPASLPVCPQADNRRHKWEFIQSSRQKSVQKPDGIDSQDSYSQMFSAW